MVSSAAVVFLGVYTLTRDSLGLALPTGSIATDMENDLT
jgi:hypothetical protein